VLSNNKDEFGLKSPNVLKGNLLSKFSKDSQIDKALLSSAQYLIVSVVEMMLSFLSVVSFNK